MTFANIPVIFIGPDDCADDDAIYYNTSTIWLPDVFCGSAECEWSRDVSEPEIDLADGVTHADVVQMLAWLVADHIAGVARGNGGYYFHNARDAYAHAESACINNLWDVRIDARAGHPSLTAAERNGGAA